MVRLWIGPVTVLPVATPIGATLLYGQLLLFVLPVLKTRHWRFLSIFHAMSLVVLVGFSRVVLGAHFLTDVLAATLFGIIWLALCMVLGKPIPQGGLRSQTAVIFADVDRPVLVPVERRAQRDSNL
jgi:hypothetical protein